MHHQLKGSSYTRKISIKISLKRGKHIRSSAVRMDMRELAALQLNQTCTSPWIPVPSYPSPPLGT